MLTTRVKEELEALSQTDRQDFINRLSVRAFLELLGAVSNEAIKAEPIPAIIWNEMATTNPNIISPATLLYWSPFFVGDANTTIEQHLTGYWYYPVQTVVNKLLALPEGKRAVLINGRTYQVGSNRPGGPVGQFATELDPLIDAQGNLLVRNPAGINDGTDPYWYEPYYYFPSYTRWVEIMKRRLDPALAEIKNRGIHIDYAVLDFEERDAGFWDIRARYQKESDLNLLFQAPRMKDFLKGAGLTVQEVRAEFLNPNAWLNKGGPVQMKWDAYAESLRAKAVYDGIFSVFEKYFPGIIASNWSNRLATDLVPGPDYTWVSGVWGTGAIIPHATITNDAYGTQQEFITPERKYNSKIPMPWGPPAVGQAYDGQNHYYTYFNSMTKMTNEANMTSAATYTLTQHWLSPPGLIDFYFNGYFGPNMKYDPSSARLVSTDGQGGGRIEDAMAELWYRNGFEGKAINLYNAHFEKIDPSWNPAKDDFFSERTLNELNEMLGYSDRRILNEAWVLVGGKRVSVGSKFYPFDEHPIIWAARANGKNIYRVILNTDRRILRDTFLKDDGSWSHVAKFQVDGKEIAIPNARIYHPAYEVSREGFWVVQDPSGTGLLEGSVNEILNSLPH